MLPQQFLYQRAAEPALTASHTGAGPAAYTVERDSTAADRLEHFTLRDLFTAADDLAVVRMVCDKGGTFFVTHRGRVRDRFAAGIIIRVQVRCPQIMADLLSHVQAEFVSTGQTRRLDTD